MNGRQNGMALVVVLWLVVLLSIMAAGHTRGTHVDTQLASRQLAVAQARGYAEAGINHTALMLLSARGQEVPVDGSIFGVAIDGTAVTLAVLPIVEPPVPASTVAVIVNVSLAAVVTVPTSQTPVPSV